MNLWGSCPVVRMLPSYRDACTACGVAGLVIHNRSALNICLFLRTRGPPFCSILFPFPSFDPRRFLKTHPTWDARVRRPSGSNPVPVRFSSGPRPVLLRLPRGYCGPPLSLAISLFPFSLSLSLSLSLSVCLCLSLSLSAPLSISFALSRSRSHAF